MPDQSHQKKILVIHGPNLNMLGKREPHIYGHQGLAEIDGQLKKQGQKLGIDVRTFQSNHEGVIVEEIQGAMGKYRDRRQPGRLYPHQRRHPGCADHVGCSGHRGASVQH